MNNFWCDKGHFNLDQANFVKLLINKHTPENVLETGFATGRSASVILANAPTLKKMISIDINFNYMKPNGMIYKKLLEDNFPNFRAIEKNSRYILNDTFLKQEFPNGIDWFTVDGDHSYRGCLHDLTSVVGHMNKNSIILVDDYKSGPPNGVHLPEVTKACDDFHIKHSYLEKEEWYCKGKGFCIFKKP